MIVIVRFNNSGDRFEDVMNVESREEAIQQAEYNFNYNKSRSGRGYYKSVQLIECEGESIEDFYEMEEEKGGYNPFWEMEKKNEK